MYKDILNVQFDAIILNFVIIRTNQLDLSVVLTTLTTHTHFSGKLERFSVYLADYQTNLLLR